MMGFARCWAQYTLIPAESWSIAGDIGAAFSRSISFDPRLRARVVHPSLGRGDRRHVSLSFVDLLFVAGHAFPRWREPGGRPPFHGRGSSNGDQAASHHHRADLRRNLDRSLRGNARCANRFGFSILLSVATIFAQKTICRMSLTPENEQPERWNFMAQLARRLTRRCGTLLWSDILVRFCERFHSPGL